jgi:hypothetical protein
MLLPMWPGGEAGPADPRNFGVQVMVLISVAGEPGSDDFRCFACSPRWLAERFVPGDSPAPVALDWDGSGRAAFGSGLVIMDEWSVDTLRGAIERLCARIEGPHWGAVASRIGRVLPWEYDYKFDAWVGSHDWPQPRPEAGTDPVGKL